MSVGDGPVGYPRLMAIRDDRPAATLSRRGPGLGGAALLLVLAIIVRVAAWPISVVNPDESIFALAAREVVQGHLPYTTLFDNKPVGSTLILAAATGIFGQSILVVRLVGVAFAWASGLLVAQLLGEHGLGRRGAVAAGAVQIAYLSALSLGGQATLTELLLAPFTVLAVLLVRRLPDATPRARWGLALSAGIACGLAVAIKLVPLLPGATVATVTLAIAWRRGGIGLGQAVSLLAIFLIAATLPMLVAATVYTANGMFDAFWWSNVGFARAYAATHPSTGVIARRLATVIDTVWPLLLATLPILVTEVRNRRRQGPADLLMLVTLNWFSAEVATAAASLQFYPHYFLTAVAPLSILSALGIRSLLDRFGSGGDALTAILLAFLAIVAIERSQADLFGERLAERDLPRRAAQVIRLASGDRTPTVFVTNYRLSAIYLLTGAPLPPTRFAIPAHLFSQQSRMIRADPAAVVGHVLATRPDFIVNDANEPLPRWARKQLQGIAGAYRLIFNEGGVQIFRRDAPFR